MDEIILIDKPAGLSSFGVVARVRRRLTERAGRKVKVGHTGTLDPFATGLLILLAGQATKRSDEFLKLDKVYEATLRFGYTSTTGDPEGEISATANPRGRSLSQAQTSPRALARGCLAATTSAPSLAQIRAILPQFTGPITQVPPAFSAIKINGQRAYKLARAGRPVTIPPRTVTIYQLELLAPDRLLVHCSSGTYIRTLAADLGQALGCGAYLTALRRLKVGDYDVRDATALDDFMQ
jgi:tRNA pseudouridine55 synthase